MSHILDERNVLDPNGREVRLAQWWRDRSHEAGHHAPPADVIAALKAAARV
jgi:hypothetical protein